MLGPVGDDALGRLHLRGVGGHDGLARLFRRQRRGGVLWSVITVGHGYWVTVFHSKLSGC
jgi:hypothetical protein